jgi:hypothetical protein
VGSGYFGWGWGCTVVVLLIQAQITCDAAGKLTGGRG